MLLISIVLCLNLELGNVLQIRGQFDMFQLGFEGIFSTYHFHAGSEQIKINNILPPNEVNSRYTHAKLSHHILYFLFPYLKKYQIHYTSSTCQNYSVTSLEIFLSDIVK